MRIQRKPSLTDSLIDALKDLGVRAVFGLPGSPNIPLYDSLRRSKIHSILTTSELAAGFMAIGWFRATGQPGVVIAMEGPGFAWSVAPLAEAAQDASAIMVITGKPSDDTQPYDQGNINQDRIATALGAATFDILDPGSARDTVRDAWDRASNHGPKPVVLQLGAQNQSSNQAANGPGRLEKELHSRDDSAFTEALAALGEARRPIIFAGGGALEHSDDLRRLVDTAGIPCLTTPTARGVVPESHPLCLATDLFFADVSSINTLLQESDLVLALGCRFSRNGTAGFRLAMPTENLIHVASYSIPTHERYRPRLAVRADIGRFLRSALAQSDQSNRSADLSWSKVKIAESRTALRSKQQVLPYEPRWLKHGDCKALFKQIRAGVPADGIVVTDTGLHQLLVRSHLDVLSPRGLIFPTDFQSMGFGLPAAIGAALAVSRRKVVAIVGDGSFLMVGAELITAKRQNLGLPVLVFCDKSLGIIRHQQIQQFGHEESTRLEENDLLAYSRWLGIEYALADERLAQQMQAAFSRTVPTLIEVRLEDSRDLSKGRRRSLIKSLLRSTIG